MSNDFDSICWLLFKCLFSVYNTIPSLWIKDSLILLLQLTLSLSEMNEYDGDEEMTKYFPYIKTMKITDQQLSLLFEREYLRDNTRQNQNHVAKSLLS